MRPITPHLWFDNQAVEAATFYATVFEDARVDRVRTIHDTPSGDADVVSFTLAGQPFMAISAGPLFTFNPSISFSVARETPGDVDALWSALGDGGSALMELGSYPFNDRYGWLRDRYGLTWQLMHAPGASQAITPSLMFVREAFGKAEEAVRFYTSVFDDSSIGEVTRYGDDGASDAAGATKFVSFRLGGEQFSAMDGPGAHEFGFNEAISLVVRCDTQEEIDRYWDALSAVPEAERCGWLTDRYGVSWQVVPTAMDRMMEQADGAAMARVTAAFLQMKKFDIAALEAAARG